MRAAIAGQARVPEYDVTIVGGGPTGLFAAFYCGMRGATCQIVDSLPELGGQLAALYPTKTIYDVAGFPAVTASDLVARLRDQGLLYGADVRLGTTVTDVRRRADGRFDIETDLGRSVSHAIILAVGIGAFRPRPLPLEEAERFAGRGVHYHLSDLEPFRRKRAVVVGGGDSAVDYALALEEVAERVTVVHRRGQFRAHEASVERLLRSRVEVRTDAQLHSIHGDDRVEGVKIRDTATGDVSELEVDAVVSGLGFVASLGPVAGWGPAMEGGAIRVDARMETTVPGIFAAGDCAAYPGKVRLIATGFGEAATAVNNAKSAIDPQAGLSPGHSSHRAEAAAR